MKRKYLNILIPLGSIALSLSIIAGCNPNKLGSYSGTPYEDSVYKGGAQIIPGKLQCEYYDQGGEGIAFHDSDSVNSGSGGLNKVDGSYLHEFRIHEAVDISYTKFQDPPIDNTPYNFVEQQADQLYVGWTNAGEWTKYTIHVERAGTYDLGLMYTANKDGLISFSVNDIDITGPLLIPSTFVAEDTVAFRQWHHWNYIDDLARIELKKGIQTFTIHTVDIGSMNYDFVNFKLVD
jgi:hypothetical protein